MVSGGGSNLGAILDAQECGRLSHARVVLVIANKPGIGALGRAAERHIESRVIPAEDEAGLLQALGDNRIELLLLAGYMRRLGGKTVERYRGRLLNIHPALLPRHGGPGMFGLRVHRAVLEAGESESGCTVHEVDEELDHGRVLAQARVPVLPGDAPEALAARVLKEEHRLYPAVIDEFALRWRQRVQEGVGS